MPINRKIDIRQSNQKLKKPLGNFLFNFYKSFISFFCLCFLFRCLRSSLFSISSKSNMFSYFDSAFWLPSVYRFSRCCCLWLGLSSSEMCGCVYDFFSVCETVGIGLLTLIFYFFAVLWWWAMSMASHEVSATI
jgi:hypothetical protein